MADRYIVQLADNQDYWVIDTTLPSDHPKKIISAHSQKEAAEDTARYQNSLEVT